MTHPVLQDKATLVTGAAMGMGATTAKLFAAAGARVAVADVDEEAAAKTVAEIEADGGTAFCGKADVSRSDQVRAMVDAVVSDYGRLDVAVDNAAIAPDVDPLHELDEDYWDRPMSIKLKGVALSLKYELQHLIKQDQGGSIINVSSARGFRPQSNAAAYVAAKHGVVGLTKVAALENGSRNIRINCVAPGAIDTPMLQAALGRKGLTEEEFAPRLSLLNRLGRADEAAQASLWRASDLSSYITGTTIHADAGYTSS